MYNESQRLSLATTRNSTFHPYDILSFLRNVQLYLYPQLNTVGTLFSIELLVQDLKILNCKIFTLRECILSTTTSALRVKPNKKKRNKIQMFKIRKI